jgi:LmbE family N-acetylglucosaminyl deacetylase
MNILFLGAHPDDIESGAGGLLIKIIGKADCYVLVFSDCEEQPGNKGITKEFIKSMKVLGVKRGNYKLLDIPNTRFPVHAEKIRSLLEEYKEKWNPDIIITHEIKNLHQDHKTLTEEALRIFRNQSILMYEDLKSTPRFVPNLIVSLTKDQIEKKLKVLECYKTQYRRYYFDMDFIKALARVRGKQMEIEFGEGFRIYQFVFI